MPSISDAKILIIATSGFEQSELVEPRDQLSSAGATVHVASPDGNDIKGWDGDDWGDTVKVDLAFDKVDAAQYDALVLPGGQINPDILRTMPEIVAFVRDFAHSGKPLAAICHAPWLLIEAGVVEGKRLTSYNSIRTDLANAGAEVVDEEVARDGNLITSRNPGDLDAFCKAIIEAVENGPAAAAA